MAAWEPCPGPRRGGAPRVAVTRPARPRNRALRARRDVSGPRAARGGRPRQRGAPAPRATCTGSPAGTTSTGASCAASSTIHAIPSRPCACSGASTTSRIRSKGCVRRWRRPARWLPTTTASGSPWPTWRPVPDGSTRPTTGSRAASRHARATRRSGAPGSNGLRPPTGLTSCCARQATCPLRAVPRAVLLKLRAWFAARRGDRRAEREALEQLIALDPEEAAGLERLADLAAEDGDRDRLAELRRRKAASDAARDRYATLVHQLDPAPAPAELARAAEALGRRFDARAWWKLAARRDPAGRAEAEAALARLATGRAASPRPAAGRSPTFSGLRRPRGKHRPASSGP